MAATERTAYEATQAHNTLTRWLQSFRFTHISKVVHNLYLELNRPVRVVDIGCNDAKLFDVLNDRVPIEYVGIERRATFSEIARKRHASVPNFMIVNEPAQTALSHIGKPDIVTALETFEHIPERDVVRIVEAIAEIRPMRLFVTVPVEIGPALWIKNLGSLVCGYVRHKEYSWAETFWAGIYQLDRLQPHGIQHKGFDWRWLAQTIRHNMRIVEFSRFPLNWLPASISTSVCIVATPR